jgi:hypothetical protein
LFGEKANMKDLGYVFYPHRRVSEPGYPRLDVFLRHVPTEHHFDPLKVRLRVVDNELGVLTLTVDHHWENSKDYLVCAGPFYLVDRNDKRLDGFTFGGQIHIEPGSDYALVSLRSAAPILFAEENATENLLLEETEILLAERQASRENTHKLFEQHLIEADPLELYHAMLVAIAENYRHRSPTGNEQVLKLTHMLRLEIEAVAEILSDLPQRTIEELL